MDSGIYEAGLESLEVKLFAEAIIELSSFEAGDQIRVDACDVNERRFGESIIDQLGNSWKDNEIISKHKMDELDAIVGAASIIAKVTRDEEIIKIENKLDHKIGSGYPSDPITILAIKKMILGKCPHKELRWSWKTTKKPVKIDWLFCLVGRREKNTLKLLSMVGWNKNGEMQIIIRDTL